jgi:pyruvate/2-oxoglutarate dehydrogenase complex dihydrolipoamide acyltransferase (E2) component
MTDVPFPPLSKEKPEAEGVVSTWFVDDGQTVTADQLLAEVQVDKVSVEVPAPVAGVVRLLVAEEATVHQGAPIARIDPP